MFNPEARYTQMPVRASRAQRLSSLSIWGPAAQFEAFKVLGFWECWDPLLKLMVQDKYLRGFYRVHAAKCHNYP